MKKLAKPTSTLLDSFYKYLFAAVLIFIPLYPKFPLFTVPFTYVAIRAEDFLIALVWLVFLVRLLVQRQIKFPRISFQFAVFFFVGLASSLSAILITQNVQPLLVLLHFFRRIEYMSVFFLIYWAGKEAGTRRYFLELSILPAVGVFLYGLAQIYFEAPVITTMNAESSKGIAMFLRPGVTLNSTFAGHYDLAVYLTMMLTFLVAISSHIGSWLKRLPFLGLFVLLLWLFMQAGSRISLLSLILSVCVVCFLYRRYLLGFVFICLIFAFIATSSQYISRFKSIFRFVGSFTSEVMVRPVFAATASPSATPAPTVAPLPPLDISTNIRLNVEWPRAMRAFYKNPFLGTGYSSITLATDNDYLRALGETGLLGLLSFLALLLGIGKFLWREINKVSGIDKIIIISAIGIFISFLTTATFIDVFESSKIAVLFWAFMGLAFSTKQS
jgi:O-antigen ligase